MILPNWSEKKVSDELMTNIHDYIMNNNDNFKHPTITKLTN